MTVKYGLEHQSIRTVILQTLIGIHIIIIIIIIIIILFLLFQHSLLIEARWFTPVFVV
jgi:hypothetical protein